MIWGLLDSRGTSRMGVVPKESLSDHYESNVWNGTNEKTEITHTAGTISGGFLCQAATICAGPPRGNYKGGFFSSCLNSPYVPRMLLCWRLQDPGRRQHVQGSGSSPFTTHPVTGP